MYKYILFLLCLLTSCSSVPTYYMYYCSRPAGESRPYAWYNMMDVNIHNNVLTMKQGISADDQLVAITLKPGCELFKQTHHMTQPEFELHKNLLEGNNVK